MKGGRRDFQFLPNCRQARKQQLCGAILISAEIFVKWQCVCSIGSEHWGRCGEIRVKMLHPGEEKLFFLEERFRFLQEQHHYHQQQQQQHQQQHHQQQLYPYPAQRHLFHQDDLFEQQQQQQQTDADVANNLFLRMPKLIPAAANLARR